MTNECPFFRFIQNLLSFEVSKPVGYNSILANQTLQKAKNYDHSADFHTTSSAQKN
jgi:hypothetical protein